MVLCKEKQARCPLSPRPRAPGQQVQAQGGESVLFSIMVPVLDQYWASAGVSTGPVLGQYWSTTVPVLGSVLDQYWASTVAALSQ